MGERRPIPRPTGERLYRLTWFRTQQVTFLVWGDTPEKARDAGIELDSRGMLDWDEEAPDYDIFRDKVSVVMTREEYERRAEVENNPKLPGIGAGHG